MEGAATRHVHRTRHFSLQDGRILQIPVLDTWDGSNQGFGIRMEGFIEDIVGGGNFTDSSQIKQNDTVAKVFHYAQVVGDKEISQLKFLVEVF